MSESNWSYFTKRPLTSSGRPQFVNINTEIERLIVSHILITDHLGKEIKDLTDAYLTSHRIYLVNHSNSLNYSLSCELSNIQHFDKEGGGLFKTAKIKIVFQTPLNQEIKISFKKGKRDEFFDILSEQLKKKKWLEDIPINNLINNTSSSNLTSNASGSSSNTSSPLLQNNNLAGTNGSNQDLQGLKKYKPFETKNAGVAGIMKRIEEQNEEERKEMDEAFSDLRTLMEKAKDMVDLAESFKNKVVERMKMSDNEENKEEEDEMLNFLLTLGLASPVTKQSSGAQYHQQLARQLVDFLDKVIEERYEGVITLTDAYCLYNRARGTDLISPEDMHQACSLFSKLKLPMKLKKFDSGVVVIQSSKYSDDRMADEIEQHVRQGEEDIYNNLRYLTAVGLAQAMNISVVLAKELLITAENKCKLCRDESEEGVRFYLVSDVFDPYL
ncbi:hypothetical protein ABK040_008941 [Willaertia magna]